MGVKVFCKQFNTDQVVRREGKGKLSLIEGKVLEMQRNLKLT